VNYSLILNRYTPKINLKPNEEMGKKHFWLVVGLAVTLLTLDLLLACWTGFEVIFTRVIGG